MSRLAQVFVVLNLVFALVFFSTSATLFLSREDLKKEREVLSRELRDSVQQMKQNVEHLKADYASQQSALNNVRGSEAKLAAERDRLLQEVKVQTARADLAESKQATAESLSTSLSNQLTAAQGRIQDLENQLTAATEKRDAALASQRQAVEERNRMKRDLDQVTADLVAQRSEYANLSQQHDELALRHRALIARTGVQDGPTDVPPPLDAVIEAVHSDLKAVVLSVGQDQDVEVGHEFAVYRGGVYIGKVKVTKLYRDLSGAKVVFEKEGARIEVGDSATTRILLSS